MTYLAFLDPQFEPSIQEMDAAHARRDKDAEMTASNLQETYLANRALESEAFERKHFGTDPGKLDFGWYERNAPHDLPRYALIFHSLGAIKREVKDSGSHYFDADTLRFFSARFSQTVYGARFFVESVANPNWGIGRTYRVCYVASGRTSAAYTVERLTPEYTTLGGAKSLAARAAKAIYPLDFGMENKS